MAMTEEARHRLYQRLEEVFGPEQATTMMEHLPPVGWADVATKQDLRELELRFGAVLHRELRLQTYTTLGAFTTLAGVLVAAGHLA